MNERITQINAELADIALQIQPLLKRREQLIAERRRLESLRFIEVNGVTRENIEFSDGDGKPSFGNIWKFAEWMRQQRQRKRFCEWNTLIYFTDEILAGRMDPDAAGRASDLPAVAHVERP